MRKLIMVTALVMCVGLLSWTHVGAKGEVVWIVGQEDFVPNAICWATCIVGLELLDTARHWLEHGYQVSEWQ
jgi:hypothetical protein